MHSCTLNLIWIKHRYLFKIREHHSQQEVNIVIKNGTALGMLSLPFFGSAGCSSTALEGPGQTGGLVPNLGLVFPCPFSSIALSWRVGRRDETLELLWACHTVPYTGTGKVYRKFLRVVRFCLMVIQLPLITFGLAVKALQGMIVCNKHVLETHEKRLKIEFCLQCPFFSVKILERFNHFLVGEVKSHFPCWVETQDI